ncbi:MAG: 4-hydroxy-3-methylbut-2-enyl diphosphate reductase [Bacteroidetes bacterium]|nr:4-hydroxy-3-methylbut-2-enyl diphosphate reductase [Bacteroidota bacterium]
MIVSVDPDAGFCFGVENAIAIAESELSANAGLKCLEDIVHNSTELGRLEHAGLQKVTHNDLPALSGEKVLIRAHGEPPDTYKVATENQVKIVDATCPIVLKLQERIGKCYQEEAAKNIQIVLFGKKGHPEILGLMGHAGNQAIIVENEDDLGRIDFSRPVRLYSQTTMDIDAYEDLAANISARMSEQFNDDLVVNNSYCRQVSRRSHTLRVFASSYDVLIFVSDDKSSNGKFLFDVCKKANPKSYFIKEPKDLDNKWFSACSTVGVTGATSTPSWLMQKVAETIGEMEGK